MKRDKRYSNSINSKSRFVLTRREFIKNSLLLTAGVTFVGCSDVLVSPFRTESPNKKVIIIGAGLSGLVAAYELSKASYDVLILEATNRIGGRVFTIRDQFFNGQFAEAGAARIPPTHNYTLHYVNEFGLQLDHFYPRTGNYIKFYDGKKKITPNEEYLAERPWPGSVTHAEYLKIRGGSDLLPRAFAQRLLSKITLDSPVKMIDQTSDLVKVRTENDNIFLADKVIVTVPLTVLNRIQFNPQLSKEKMEAANGDYNYASSTRVYLQTKSRFWEKDNLNGWGKTDWPEEMWQPTFDQNGTSGIIMNYASNRRADELDELGNNARVLSLIDRWNEIFPELMSYYESGTSFSWVQQKYEKGAYASPSSKQKDKYDSYISLPEGKIHFAGEHISNYHGWMQGALESGLRVVNEIISKDIYA